jgi:hypothetical protein
MKRVILAACVAALILAAPTSASASTSSHKCGSFNAPQVGYPSVYADDVRTLHVSCRTARRVVRYYAAHYPASPHGWKCEFRRPYGDGSWVCFPTTSVGTMIWFILADRD